MDWLDTISVYWTTFSLHDFLLHHAKENTEPQSAVITSWIKIFLYKLWLYIAEVKYLKQPIMSIPLQ